LIVFYTIKENIFHVKKTFERKSPKWGRKMQNIDDKNKSVERVCKLLNKNLEYLTIRQLESLDFMVGFGNQLLSCFPFHQLPPSDLPQCLNFNRERTSSPFVKPPPSMLEL
jgi:hypothetical protein